MEKILHPAATRGTANLGWLQARYSFSFANYFDSDRLQFGLLRVLNDDIIAPSMGFGTHAHNNMEIVTIPQFGAIKHKDSMGNEGIISSGDIQVMSAGSGVQHSEINASHEEELKLFQIWVLPETEDVIPRYDQKKIADIIRPNAFSAVVKPKSVARKNELWIHQQTYFNIGEFSKKTNTTYTLQQEGHGIYLLVIKGAAIVENEILGDRDAIGIWDTKSISMTIEKDSRVLLIEVPMN
jgi:quercetin 2,3-dioxygenase